MFGELCERCGCFLELHSIIASVVVLLNDLAEIDNQHRWFFLLIYTSVLHALFTRGRCLVPSKMTHMRL